MIVKSSKGVVIQTEITISHTDVKTIQTIAQLSRAAAVRYLKCLRPGLSASQTANIVRRLTQAPFT